jgi:16S rRNA (uracil1498-N3)-methyltransferase
VGINIFFVLPVYLIGFVLKCQAMKIHRFCLPELKDSKSEVGAIFEITEKETVHQLKDVFRFEAGDLVNIFDGEGAEVQAEILSLSKSLANFKITKVFSSSEILTQRKDLTLAFALLKNDHTEMVLEKCTELGVTTFQPLLTDRTIKTGFRRDRLEKIIKEAAEQSGFVRLPKLAEPIKLESYIQKIGVGNVFVMDMDGEKLPDFNESSQDGVVVLVGPEGGWSDSERELFKSLHLTTFSLAPQTLRAETACIAAVAKLI